jgi:hypothetical protein
MRHKAPRPHCSITSQRAAGSEELFRGASNPPDINNQDDDAVDEAQLIKKIKVYVEKGDKAKDKAEQYYASAGLLLKTLNENSPSKAEWEKLIKSKCGLSTSRAYELIQIADGRKTVADVRLANTKRKRKERSVRDVTDKNLLGAKGAGSSVTDGQDLPTKKEAHVPITPTATTAKSWKVEVIAKDGRRYGNGVRLRTEEEADAYRFNAVLEMERKDQLIIVVATEVIPCADPGGFHQIRRRKNGKLTHTLEFVHGSCGTLEWEEIATPASIASAAACVSEVETIVRAAIRGLNLEERRELHEQLQDAIAEIMVDAAVVADLDLQEEEPAHQQEAVPFAAGDDLDIPDYLRRTPKDATAS